MADFLQAYSKVVAPNEGGYRNDPVDKGGETYKGVSRKYNPNWPGWSIIDQYKRKGPIKNGTKFNDPTLDKLVRDLFKNNYWTPNRLDQVTNQSLAAMCLDAIIQHGYAERKIINPALKQMNPDIILSDTLRQTAIDTMNSNPQRAYNLIAASRVAYVKSLQGSLGSDFAGVLARAQRFLSAFMAGGGNVLVLAGVFFLILYLNSKK